MLLRLIFHSDRMPGSAREAYYQGDKSIVRSAHNICPFLSQIFPPWPHARLSKREGYYSTQRGPHAKSYNFYVYLPKKSQTRWRSLFNWGIWYIICTYSSSPSWTQIFYISRDTVPLTQIIWLTMSTTYISINPLSEMALAGLPVNESPCFTPGKNIYIKYKSYSWLFTYSTFSAGLTSTYVYWRQIYSTRGKRKKYLYKKIINVKNIVFVTN